jgi:ribosome-associated heat shock protein Hsp15
LRDDRQRLDKWLWFARFARTRPAAVRLVEDGHVRVEGRRITSPSHALKLGDVLTLALPHATVLARVVALGERRSPYEEARQLYSRLDEERGDASLAEDGSDG